MKSSYGCLSGDKKEQELEGQVKISRSNQNSVQKLKKKGKRLKHFTNMCKISLVGYQDHLKESMPATAYDHKLIRFQMKIEDPSLGLCKDKNYMVWIVGQNVVTCQSTPNVFQGITEANSYVSFEIRVVLYFLLIFLGSELAQFDTRQGLK